MTVSTTQATEETWVACLCAQWCGTCRGYQEVFNDLHQQFPQTAWHWVDIEEWADKIDPLDLENFPTLLIARAGHPTFFGPVTPQPETLLRLLQAKLAVDAPALNAPDAASLLLRLQTQFK